MFDHILCWTFTNEHTVPLLSRLRDWAFLVPQTPILVPFLSKSSPPRKLLFWLLTALKSFTYFVLFIKESVCVLFVFVFFCSTLCLWDSSKFLCVVVDCSLSLLNSILLCDSSTTYLSILLLMGIWVVSSFELWQSVAINILEHASIYYVWLCGKPNNKPTMTYCFLWFCALAWQFLCRFFLDSSCNCISLRQPHSHLAAGVGCQLKHLASPPHGLSSSSKLDWLSYMAVSA